MSSWHEASKGTYWPFLYCPLQLTICEFSIYSKLFCSDRGLDYVISFGIGAAIATLAGWALRLSIASCRQKSLNAGYASLPSMHLSKIIIPGALSGTLWSLGNIGQIISVTLLGETIGMSIVQSQMIISGILGIMWFGEIKGIKMIMGWVLSAIVTFIGIICLSGEHKS